MTDLISLADHKAPSMPAEHRVHSMLVRIKKKIVGKTKDAILSNEGLDRAALRLPDEAVGPPACRAITDALTNSISDWLGSNAPQSWTRVIVVPPCDEKDIVETWARSAGHQVVSPPTRSGLADPDFAARLNFDGDGLVVIPSLERWFLRQREGLNAIRSLFAQLAVLKRQCLIGCNSWAWAFLVKATGVEIMLPETLTFAPFDAARLRDWLAESSTDSAGNLATFRLARTGEDVLAVEDDGTLRSGHLQKLAARSLGIPWVAWHLWRASLRVRADTLEPSDRITEKSAEDSSTVWVAGLDDIVLPKGYDRSSLLTLQALLIHGVLSKEELESVLPATGEPDVVPALLAGGFVESNNGSFRVHAAAYPEVRQALNSAGFPLGIM